MSRVYNSCFFIFSYDGPWTSTNRSCSNPATHPSITVQVLGRNAEFASKTSDLFAPSWFMYWRIYRFGFAANPSLFAFSALGAALIIVYTGQTKNLPVGRTPGLLRTRCARPEHPGVSTLTFSLLPGAMDRLGREDTCTRRMASIKN